ncbi:MAG: polyprenyl diphosphate synthase [Acidobacteriota bacterium]
MINDNASTLEGTGALGGARPSTLGQERPGLKTFWGLAKEIVKRPFYAVYTRRLRSKIGAWRKPQHLGIIMDGNRRFARHAGFGRVVDGHQKGADKLQEVLSWCLDVDIPVVTVWCFSIENFQRSAEEVEDLLGLFEDKARQMADDEELHRRRIRVRFIGRIELLPESLREEIRRLEDATASYDQATLNIAMAYGGREEIADAFRSHVNDRLEAGDGVDQILSELDVSAIGSCLYTSGQPEPDLILRTSGEVRLSGFLMWQSAHSEFYFCDSTWPSFREIDFLRALRSYDDRQRRFGR